MIKTIMIILPLVRDHLSFYNATRGVFLKEVPLHQSLQFLKHVFVGRTFNFTVFFFSLEWRHNGCNGVSNHQPHDCLLNRLFWRTSKKTSTLRFTGLCAGNSPGTGVFPAQMASNLENVFIWWRHHVPCHMFHLFMRSDTIPGFAVHTRNSNQ